MSTTQVPPEIMEEIEKELSNKLLFIFNEDPEDSYDNGYNRGASDMRNHAVDAIKEVLSKSQIALEKQWIDVNEDTKFPDCTFIGCEEGSNWVGEVMLHNDKVYRITDFYHQDSITLSRYQTLPAPPTQ